MDSDIVIETRNLTKVYRDFWGRQKVRALKALDLEVRRGEIFGLLGPNGSGKTTTIKLLLGLLFPTSGQALVFGRDATEVTKNERIGYLPEESYLYRFLNAEETLDFYGRLFNMPRGVRRQRVADLIEMVGLGWAKRRQLKEYSKGMTRRIGLAQALINDPELILLDEPTTGLDPDRHPRNEGPDPPAARRGQDDRHVQPPAGRRAGRVRPHRHPVPGRVEGVGPGRQPAEGPRRDARSAPRASSAEAQEEIRQVIERHQGPGAVDGQSHHHAGRAVREDHRESEAHPGRRVRGVTPWDQGSAAERTAAARGPSARRRSDTTMPIETNDLLPFFGVAAGAAVGSTGGLRSVAERCYGCWSPWPRRWPGLAAGAVAHAARRVRDRRPVGGRGRSLVLLAGAVSSGISAWPA